MSKIAFVSRVNPRDIEKYSGSTYHINQALIESGFEMDYIYGFPESHWRLLRWKRDFYKKVFDKRYLIDRSPVRINAAALKIQEQLKNHNAEVVFSESSLSICKLKTNLPIVFYTDSTFASMLDYYTEFSNLSRETIKNGLLFEKLALDNCTKAIYTSDWAANSAMQDFDIASNKIEVVPRGANFQVKRSMTDFQQILANKKHDVCHLLFVGKDWERKGGKFAVNVVKQFNEKGIPAELTIVGCQPDIEESSKSFVHIQGYLNKNNPDDLAKMIALYDRSHYFLLPTYAECFGISFSEAAAFGLPSIAFDTGGVGSAVVNGKNGQLFDLKTIESVFSDFIYKNFTDKTAYNALAISSFQEYLTRLNWDASGKQLAEIIGGVL